MEQAWLETLTTEECLDCLRAYRVGRVAVIVNGYPVVLPVNYRLVEYSGGTWLALRTRPGGVIDSAPLPAALEIDGVDATNERGWSVVVRGSLQHVDPDAADFRDEFDPEPWLTEDRDAWLVIEPFDIAGRRLQRGDAEWSFHPDAYL